MAVALFQPLPAIGDLVWCKFPQAMNTPGPKSRPALVLNLVPEHHAVMVAYGTSQKTHKIYKGEFVIKEGVSGFDISGLACSTKFDLGQRRILPFNSDWFDVAQGAQKNTPLPKLGTIPPVSIADLRRAWKVINGA